MSKSGNAVAKAKRKSRGLQRMKSLDAMPVRTCDTSCRFRREGKPGCDLFQAKKCSDGDDCIVDLQRINNWRHAYNEGDPDLLKGDAGSLMGATYVMAMRMLDQIIEDGFTLTAPAFDRHGDPLMFEEEDGDETVQRMVYITKAHPLWQPFIKLLGRLGMDLKEFGLTPGRKQEAPTVRGLIGEAGTVNMQVVMVEQQEQIDRFREGAAEAQKLREQDPVYQRYAGGDPKQGELKRLEKGLAEAGSGRKKRRDQDAS